MADHPREKPNRLREWLEQHQQRISLRQFAVVIGVTPSYVSQLTRDNPPWPRKAVVRRIWEVTGGDVSPNDLAGVSRFPRRSARAR